MPYTNGQRVRRIIAALIAVTVAFLAVVLWRHFVPGHEAKTSVEKIPAFALHDNAGQVTTEGVLAGRPALIAVWASWCAACPDTLADVAKIQQEFSDRLAVVAINRGEARETAVRVGTEAGIVFLPDATSTIFLLDPDDTYYHAIGGFAMPELLLIDRMGLVQLHKRGPVIREELHRLVEDLVTE